MTCQLGQVGVGSTVDANINMYETTRFQINLHWPTKMLYGVGAERVYWALCYVVIETFWICGFMTKTSRGNHRHFLWSGLVWGNRQ